jgi:GNAT superfamily N-acetyltransferase
MPISSPFTLRPATAADIPALGTLIEASVRQLQLHDYTPAQIDGSLGSAFGVDRQLIADHTYFVATPTSAHNQLVACGGWSFRKTLCGSDTPHGIHSGPHSLYGPAARDASTLSPLTDYAKIRAIFVHPAFARRGLGTLLLAHCEAAAHAAGFTRFEMGSTLTGVPLYTLKGYIPRDRITIPLPNGELLPIVVMNKTL